MPLHFLSGGAVGEMMRQHEWSLSPLGAPATWPQPLKTIVDVILGANQPMFAVWGPQKAILYNDGYAEILGGHHPSALGRPFFEVWSEIIDDVGPLMERGYAGQPTYMDDIQLTMYRHGYAEETHFSFFYTPLRDEQGTVSGVFCGCTEITAQVFAERERLAELERFRELFKQSPSFVTVLRGPDHRFEFVNPTYLQLIAHRKVIDMPVRDALPELEGQNFVDLLDEVYTTGTPFSAREMPITILRSIGAAPEQRYLDFVYQPLRNANGVITGIFCEGIDVTDKRANEVALRESQARNRQILDSASDYAIIATNLQGDITLWSQGAEQVMGWTEKEMVGQTVDCLFTPEDRAVRQAETERHIALENGMCPDERWHLRKSGERFWATGEMMPLRDEAGNINGLVKVLRDRTDQHRSAQAVKFLNEQLEVAQSAGGVGMFTVDIKTDQLTGTTPFWRIFGLPSKESADPKIVEQLIVPEDAQLVSNQFSRFQGTATLKAIYRIRRADDDQQRWLSRSAEYQLDKDGVPVALTGVVQDITERQTAELLMRESEEKFRTFAQVMPNHVWTASPDGQLDWLNEQMLEYSGYRFEELQGNQWPKMVHPEDRAPMQSAWKHALATGERFEIEARLHCADTTCRWHLIRALPIRDANGAIAHWIGTNTDIEAQREARALLESDNETLERRIAQRTSERDRIWNNSQDLLVLMGPDGYFRDVNPTMKRVLGFDASEVNGCHFTEFIVQEDHAPSLIALNQATQTPLESFENRYWHRDGSFRWFSWSASTDQNGMVYASGRHITAEKEAQDALLKAEEALRQSQKMEALGQLTGGIAHDFNNLLQGITGSLEVLKIRLQMGRHDDLERFIAGAMNSANRAAGLIHRLLAFSRRQPLAPKPVKANALISTMEDLLRRSLGERIEQEVVLAGGLWLTRCDPNQLESAILNLCINARDAMPDGGKLIIETCNAHLDHSYAAKNSNVRAGQYICISVSDTGTGMSPDIISKVFDPFFTTKPIGQGTGLGLSMIYGFAQQSEGHARIYSEVGCGTTVRLYLPRYRGDVKEDEEVLQIAKEHLTTESETVLVVEDEPVVRTLIIEALQELGYQSLEAVDGQAGLKILQSTVRVDLLVTDVGLPGLNGRQLADAARKSRPELKVLFMTGYAENAAVANGFLEPGMEMITKPFPMEQLASRLRKMMRS